MSNFKNNDKINKEEKEYKTSKKPKKPKIPKKENEYEIEIDKYTLEQVHKLNVKKVFVTNSLLKDEKIINGMIYEYKILKYKCCNTKCSVSTEWLSNPINLLLVRKNNKENDLRISNLEYSCYNCYFQKNNNENIFNKVKKSAVLECKICNFNLNNMSEINKDLGMCKICLSKFKSPSIKTNQLDLFRNTFENDLTFEDINDSCINDSGIDSIDQLDNMSVLLNCNYTNNDDIYLSSNNTNCFTKSTHNEILTKNKKTKCKKMKSGKKKLLI